MKKESSRFSFLKLNQKSEGRRSEDEDTRIFLESFDFS